MDTVEQVLDAKGRDVYSVSPAASVFDALQLMADKNIGALLVLDAGKLAGIFSERDYARKVILKGKASKQTQVREIMSSRVLCVGLKHTMPQCLALMSDKRLRHLPVWEGGKAIGVISIGDAVGAVISEQKFIIGELERYISGT
ncbi:MAG: CBS domain-containing protein [Deltaproteobacteria bacterium]|nr:CBS domain-containing protein [Deltaproteobacteria bacterium]